MGDAQQPGPLRPAAPARARHRAGPTGAADEEQAALRRAEEQLDQCWDLLRQRRARRESGQSPDDAAVRPVAEVEGYLQ